MTRLHPLKALRVAQLRCDAAVTITITGPAGSGKSTAAEVIAQALGNRGYTSAVIESDDSISHHSQIAIRKAVENLDDRLYLVVVEDSKIGFKRPEQAQPEPKQEEAEKDCDGECEDCGSEVPPILKAILIGAMLKAKRQGM